MKKSEKILILGGKPIGSREIVEYAKRNGYFTIVADYLPMHESPAKKISDEQWNISTAETDKLAELCMENNVTAILAGVHEFNIEKKIELCEKLKLSSYCSSEQWLYCENKAKFKSLCEQFNISVAKTYTLEDMAEGRIEYPVIVKPVDSSGSRGFSVCHNDEELKNGIAVALEFSQGYLIEEYLQCEACIIHYTAINGEIIFSGMSDKHSQRLEGKSSVMALQTFPSASMQRYLESTNEKVISMYHSIGVTDGPIWIEVFNDIKTGRFVFNEMGYRFGGSMTNYPVQHFYGIDQMSLMIEHALGHKIKEPIPMNYVPDKKMYCILPIHLKPGIINKIDGFDYAQKIENVKAIVQVHDVGDTIENWGTAQQVFCYLHVSYDSNEELASTLTNVISSLRVFDMDDNQMLFCLFDVEKLGVTMNDDMEEIK